MHFLQTQNKMQKMTSAEITARAITAHCGNPVFSSNFAISSFAIVLTYL